MLNYIDLQLKRNIENGQYHFGFDLTPKVIEIPSLNPLP